jgi:hypothetical protein
VIIITNCKAQKRNDNGQYENSDFETNMIGEPHELERRSPLSYRPSRRELYLGRRGPDRRPGTFGNVVSARQAMLDHAGLGDLPTEEPWYGPAARVVGGWFIGSTEYLIEF